MTATNEKIMYVCPRCQAVFKGEPGTPPVCGGCRLDTIEAGYGETEWYEKTKEERAHLAKLAVGQPDYSAEELLEMIRDIKLTTGYCFDGYHITEYLDICTGTCVMGTGFLSTLSANWSDFLGTTSNAYEDKLERAKDMSIKIIKQNAAKLGANAIIGVDIDYTTFRADIMGVIATGTAVIIQKENKMMKDDYK